MSGMRRKRWLAAVMAAALMLGGCQSGGSQDTAQTQEGGTEQTQAQVQESESQDTDVVSLKYLHVSESFDPETDYTRELIRELLNVDIIPEMGNEDDKVNLILSSGQDYDMIKLTNRNLLISYVQNDVIWPLDEYIDQYPDLKTLLRKMSGPRLPSTERSMPFRKRTRTTWSGDSPSARTGWMLWEKKCLPLRMTSIGF